MECESICSWILIDIWIYIYVWDEKCELAMNVGSMDWCMYDKWIIDYMKVFTWCALHLTNLKELSTVYFSHCKFIGNIDWRSMTGQYYRVHRWYNTTEDTEIEPSGYIFMIGLKSPDRWVYHGHYIQCSPDRCAKIHSCSKLKRNTWHEYDMNNWDMNMIWMT